MPGPGNTSTSNIGKDGRRPDGARVEGAAPVNTDPHVTQPSKLRELRKMLDKLLDEVAQFVNWPPRWWPFKKDEEPNPPMHP
jgi:hypothetical protein